MSKQPKGELGEVDETARHPALRDEFDDAKTVIAMVSEELTRLVATPEEKPRAPKWPTITAAPPRPVQPSALGDSMLTGTATLASVDLSAPSRSALTVRGRAPHED